MRRAAEAPPERRVEISDGEKRGRRQLKVVSGSGNNSLELGVCVEIGEERRQRRLFYFVKLNFLFLN